MLSFANTKMISDNFKAHVDSWSEAFHYVSKKVLGNDHMMDGEKFNSLIDLTNQLLYTTPHEEEVETSHFTFDLGGK